MPLTYARELTGRTRKPGANQQLGYVLAGVAGAINAGGFLAVRQYTSHMTGIVSSMADSIALGESGVVLTGLGAVLSFLIGAATCAVLVNHARRRRMHSAYALPLLLEAALLLCFGLLGAQLSRIEGLFVPATVMLLCFIMGLQNAVITKISKAEIRTTHITGMATDLGIELGKLIYWNAPNTPPALRVRADRKHLRVLASLLAAFFFGGVAGALGFKHLGYASTLPLAGLLVAMAIVPAVDDLRALVNRLAKPAASAGRHVTGPDPMCRSAQTRGADDRTLRGSRSSDPACPPEKHPMSYATLMVNLIAGRPNAGLLKIAAELAERFHAGVVGIAARQPLPMVFGDGYVSGDLYQQDRNEIARELKASEAEFRAALQGRVAFVEWRAAEMFASQADYLAQESRCADLLLTGVGTGDMFDASRTVNIGELILQTGRPVLIVPSAATTLTLGHVLIGWKDTREARRAVADALPLLQQATRVSVVEIAAEADLPAARRHVADVVAWLGRHAVPATGSARQSTGDDAAALYAIGQNEGIDLVVAGAYGHSRLREWVLGGVTRDLLMSANRCSLVSH